MTHKFNDGAESLFTSPFTESNQEFRRFHGARERRVQKRFEKNRTRGVSHPRLPSRSHQEAIIIFDRNPRKLDFAMGR